MWRIGLEFKVMQLELSLMLCVDHLNRIESYFESMICHHVLTLLKHWNDNWNCHRNDLATLCQFVMAPVVPVTRNRITQRMTSTLPLVCANIYRFPPQFPRCFRRRFWTPGRYRQYSAQLCSALLYSALLNVNK